MPATKNRFSKCGHSGYGGYCHRCDQADKLEAAAKKLQSTRAAPKEGKQVIGQDEATKLLTEAARLRGISGAKVNA